MGTAERPGVRVELPERGGSTYPKAGTFFMGSKYQEIKKFQIGPHPLDLRCYRTRRESGLRWNMNYSFSRIFHGLDYRDRLYKVL